MFPTDTDWLAHQAHHKDLLWIAEQERLTRAALRTQSERENRWCKIIGWIGARLPRLAWKQRPACDTQPPLTARETATQSYC